MGIRDLADGEFRPGDTTLEEGIKRQLNYLLDEVGCNRPGFRLLEIGSGYGHLLRLAQQRGARAVGVNVSSEQVRYCNDRGFRFTAARIETFWKRPSGMASSMASSPTVLWSTGYSPKTWRPAG